MMSNKKSPNNRTTSGNSTTPTNLKPMVSLDEFISNRTGNSSRNRSATAIKSSIITDLEEKRGTNDVGGTQFGLGLTGGATMKKLNRYDNEDDNEECQERGYNTGAEKVSSSNIKNNALLQRRSFHKSSLGVFNNNGNSKGGHRSKGLLSSPSASSATGTTRSLTSASGGGGADPLAKSRTSTSTGIASVLSKESKSSSKISRDDSAAALSLQSFHANANTAASIASMTSCRTPSICSSSKQSNSIYGTPMTATTATTSMYGKTICAEQLSVYSKQSNASSSRRSFYSNSQDQSQSLSLSHRHLGSICINHDDAGARNMSQSNLSIYSSSSASGLSLTLSHHPGDPSAISSSSSYNNGEDINERKMNIKDVTLLESHRSQKDRLHHHFAKSSSVMLLLDDGSATTDDEQDSSHIDHDYNDHLLLQHEKNEEDDEGIDEERFFLMKSKSANSDDLKQEATRFVVEHLEVDDVEEEEDDDLLQSCANKKTDSATGHDGSKRSHGSKSEPHVVPVASAIAGSTELPVTDATTEKEASASNKKCSTSGTHQKHKVKVCSEKHLSKAAAAGSSPSQAKPAPTEKKVKNHVCGENEDDKDKAKLLPSREIRELSRRAMIDLNKNKFKGSTNYKGAMENLVRKAACLEFSELTLGTVLGEGQFGVVSAVRGINITKAAEAAADDDPTSVSGASEKLYDKHQTQLREYVHARVLRRQSSTLDRQSSSSLLRGDSTTNIKGDTKGSSGAVSCIEKQSTLRYAVKVLKDTQCCDRVQFFNAYRDMAIEIHLLAAMDHKHILKVRGVSPAVLMSQDHVKGSGSSNNTGSGTLFLMTDRLHCTLKDKFVDWRLYHKQLRLSSSSRRNGRRLYNRLSSYHDLVTSSSALKDSLDQQQLTEEEKQKQQQQQLSSFIKEQKRQLLETRLRVLRDVASAIHYMHTKGIMQRDLKPDNIGFDHKGDVKLFDFGLGSEFPIAVKPSNNKQQQKQDTSSYGSPANPHPIIGGRHSPPSSPLCSKGGKKRDKTELTLYNLTGRTGSLRYMAPENYLHQPYNESIDVYAFSIIVWQTVTLQHLYPNYDKQMIVTNVIKGGQRPELSSSTTANKHQRKPTIGKALEEGEAHDKRDGAGAGAVATSTSTLAITESVKKLLKQMWSNNISMRPSAKYVLNKLNRELALIKEAKFLLIDRQQEGNAREEETHNKEDVSRTKNIRQEQPQGQQSRSNISNNKKKSNDKLHQDGDDGNTNVKSSHHRFQHQRQYNPESIIQKYDKAQLERLSQSGTTSFDLEEAKKRLKEQQEKYELRKKKCGNSGRNAIGKKRGTTTSFPETNEDHAIETTVPALPFQSAAPPTVDIDLLYEPQQDLPSSYFGGNIRTKTNQPSTPLGLTITNFNENVVLANERQLHDDDDGDDHLHQEDSLLLDRQSLLLKRSNTRAHALATPHHPQHNTTSASRQEKANDILAQLEATLDMSQYAEKARATSNLLAQLEKTLDLGAGVNPSNGAIPNGATAFAAPTTTTLKKQSSHYQETVKKKSSPTSKAA